MAYWTDGLAGETAKQWLYNISIILHQIFRGQCVGEVHIRIICFESTCKVTT